MKTLYAMLGTPGVGKTTFIETVSKEIFEDNRLNRYVVGPDLIRGMIQSPVAKPDGTFGISQDNEKYVWEIVNGILDKKVEMGELIIVDATHSRNKAINNYKKYADLGYRIVLIDFTEYANLDEIFKRNKERVSYKFVPEHVVETIYERIQDLDIPGWCEVITPDKFKDHLLDVKHDWSEFDDITVVGDIHGCADEFMDTLSAVGIDPAVSNPKKAIVLVGDYFDRGPKIPETFKILQELQKNYFVLPLIGNHEEPLVHYKEFVVSFNEEVQQWIKNYVLGLKEHEKPVFTEKPNPSILGKFNNWRKKKGLMTTAELEKETDNWARTIESLPDLPTRTELASEFEGEAIKLCKLQRGVSFKKLDEFIQNLKQYPNAFASLEELVNGYRFQNEEFFVKNTSRNAFRRFILSDIKYTEVSQFYKRLAQLCYVDFRGQEIVITHGGLSNIPSKLTPTADMIRGVGGYPDALVCDETFFANTHGNVIGIHGHRNTSNIPIKSSAKTYNINGDVDLGMRAVVINQELDASFEVKTFEIAPRAETLSFYREKQIKAAQRFNAKKLTAAEEGGGLIRLFQDHTHVDVKRLPNDIASINFTRKAFEKGYWDGITIKARGLFLDIDTDDNPKDVILARGYEKFFNVGEKYGIGMSDIRHQVFPIKAYEKANGFLGILSVDNRDPEKPVWFTASKTTTLGDYADNFRTHIEPHLNEDLMTIMIEQNLTLLFEVIDPKFDPHILTYFHPELVLLEAIKNQLSFEKLDYQELRELVYVMTPGEKLRVKNIVKVCEKTTDFSALITEMNKQPIFTDNGHEGYVFESSAEEPYMFKVKSDWYIFWKRLRSTRDRIAARLKRHYKNGNEVVLTKSELVSFKAHLHTAEDIKAFKFLVTLSEADPELTKSLSIPELRRSIIGMMEADKAIETKS